MTRLIDELQRRSVFRVIAAYLALAWLLLQVIDTVISLLDLPNWVGRLSLIVIAIGFPVAIVLTWVYELTPEGIRETGDVHSDEPVPRFGGRKIDFVIIGALMLVVVLLLVKDRFIPESDPQIAGPPLVTEYRQLTRSPVIFPPWESPYPLVADASRLYFNDFDSARMRVRELSQAGGNTVPFELQWDKGGIALRPTAMTPDGSSVVMTRVDREQQDWLLETWAFPVVGGAPRKIGDGANAAYSRDGRLIAYWQGNRLIVAKADMTEPTELFSTDAHIYWIDFSPDGKKLRCSVWDQGRTIWEFPLDGSRGRPILPEWESIEHCCGSWTPDGKYYVFQAKHGFRTQLWAIDESGESSSEPLQITSGVLDFRRPTIAPDGKNLFAIGWQLRGEVVRYDFSANRFVPMPGFEEISGEWFSYSIDGQSVVYLSYPETDLWRSNSDGTNRTQLTFDPMRPLGGRISPDGRYVAFEGELPGKQRQIYIMPSDGGVPEPMSPEDTFETSPTWSADSSTIAFTQIGTDEILLYDIASGSVSVMPGTEGLYYPDWSPDGRYIGAWTRDGAVALLNVHTGERKEILGPDTQIQVWYWAKDSQHIYFVDELMVKPDGAMHRINIADESTAKIVSFGGIRSAFGIHAWWVGVDPNGAPLMLRDLSIHNIYELDWLRAEDNSTR